MFAVRNGSKHSSGVRHFQYLHERDDDPSDDKEDAGEGLKDAVRYQERGHGSVVGAVNHVDWKDKNMSKMKSQSDTAWQHTYNAHNTK